MTTPSPNTLRDEAMKRLHHRAARLIRLLNLEAPDPILIGEVQLLASAARLLNPDAWAQAESQHWLALHKPALGFCAEPECENRILDDSDDVCPDHAEEDEDDDVEYAPGPKLIEAMQETRAQLEGVIADPSTTDIVRATAKRELEKLNEMQGDLNQEQGLEAAAEQQEQAANPAEDPEPDLS